MRGEEATGGDRRRRRHAGPWLPGPAALIALITAIAAIAIPLGPASTGGQASAALAGPSEKPPVKCSETPTGQWPEPEGLFRSGACL
ncbi:MAG: hypothetical protein KGJ43_03715, partial [Acidobacteriota bacterium]|nr:hypothetical protein [Acidobacteriota bacterium]